jgi:hypothetical protein
MGERRHTHGVPDPQVESVKHSSYEHPPALTKPSQGKQRPFIPALHWLSDEQAFSKPE